jgi:hypothetical protein
MTQAAANSTRVRLAFLAAIDRIEAQIDGAELRQLLAQGRVNQALRVVERVTEPVEV